MIFLGMDERYEGSVVSVSNSCCESAVCTRTLEGTPVLVAMYLLYRMVYEDRPACSTRHLLHDDGVKPSGGLI